MARLADFEAGSNGTYALRDALAKINLPTCLLQNGVSQRTGNVTSADNAINTRFDIWEGPYNNSNYRKLTVA